MNFSKNSCLTIQTFNTFSDFYACYQTLFKLDIATSIIEILFIVSVFIFNLVVIIRIRRKKEVILIYDKIIIWLSASYILTSLVDFPFFHIEDLFEYWPFGDVTSILWTIYDNNMSTFLSLLILYMTYARLRSVQAPMTFSSEKLLKFPHLVICVFWLTGIICWTLAAVLFRIYPFTTHIAYKPDFSQFIIN